MARKLKTFTTSMGFFDLAIAAPSMKAALEAWGSKTNLFHMELAQETDDPAVVEATMAKPGVVLKRPVGTAGAFKLDAKLPSRLPIKEGATKKRTKPAEPTRSKPDAKSEKAAAAAYQRERQKRERAERKEEAAQKRRDAAAAEVEAEIEAAEQNHQKRTEAINAKREAIDELFKAEEARWEKERQRLRHKLRSARK